MVTRRAASHPATRSRGRRSPRSKAPSTVCAPNRVSGGSTPRPSRCAGHRSPLWPPKSRENSVTVQTRSTNRVARTTCTPNNLCISASTFDCLDSSSALILCTSRRFARPRRATAVYLSSLISRESCPSPTDKPTTATRRTDARAAIASQVARRDACFAISEKGESSNPPRSRSSGVEHFDRHT